MILTRILGPLAMAAAVSATPLAQNDYIGPTVKLSDGRQVNALAHYWTDVVGMAFDRDAAVDVPPTVLDLDLDRNPDLRFSGKWSLPGGILKNPRLVGLTPTPDDPAGTVGKYSISTGYLGIRQEMDSATKKGTGRYALNCWHCHGSADEHGKIVFGKPSATIFLGLMMATSRVMDPGWVIRERPDAPPMPPAELAQREGLDSSVKLDADGDGKVTIAEWRAALRMPPADVARAMLLLAGPGRLDQSVDFRMDGLIPLANLQHFQMMQEGAQAFAAGRARAKYSVFNPVSLPQNLSGLGVEHYSWSGKDSSMRYDTVAVICARTGASPEDVAKWIGMPVSGGKVDYEALSRAITLDFRNVGTFGTESDSIDAMTWSHHVLSEGGENVLREIPARYEIHELREELLRPRVASSQPAAMAALIARGRRIFVEETTGEIINQRVVLGREARRPDEFRGIPVLAPLDRSQPITARIGVKCASCHNYSPMSTMRSIAQPLEDMQRCGLCHFDHPELLDHKERREGQFISMAEHVRREKLRSSEDCFGCHKNHPDFGAQAYSNSWLLPFDANANGITHGDERADAAAGGIGTDACLNLESLFVLQLRPPNKRPERMYLIADDARTVPVKLRFSSAGSGWVRVAPLVMIGQTAPYLHNGSVPTLEALLSPPGRRPQSFAVGTPEQDFLFDTTIPGNRNGGHLFGVNLGADDRKALVAFLKSLP